MLEKLRFPQVRRLALLTLLVPCVLLCIPAFTAYRAQQELGKSFEAVSQTLALQNELQRLLTLLLEAESSQRGFLLSGREDYLETYGDAFGKIRVQIKHIRTLAKNNPRQQETLRALQEPLAKKLEFMAEIVARQQHGESKGALEMVATGRGKRLMDDIRRQIRAMEREELEGMALREATLAGQASRETLLLLWVALLNLAFVAVMLLMFHRALRLEELVRICAWSNTVEYQGEWLSFDQYLARRFNLNTSHGISPAEAEKVLGPRHKPPPNVESPG